MKAGVRLMGIEDAGWICRRRQTALFGPGLRVCLWLGWELLSRLSTESAACLHVLHVLNKEAEPSAAAGLDLI